MSAFLSLADAVVAALLQAPAVAGGAVERCHSRPMPEERDAEVLVWLDRADGQAAGIADGPLDWQTLVRIEMQARAAGALDAEQAVDAVLSTVFARLAPAQLGLLSAGVMDLVLLPTIEWQYAQADERVVGALLTLQATQRTQGTTLNPWS